MRTRLFAGSSSPLTQPDVREDAHRSSSVDAAAPEASEAAGELPTGGWDGGWEGGPGGEGDGGGDGGGKRGAGVVGRVGQVRKMGASGLSVETKARSRLPHHTL